MVRRLPQLLVITILIFGIGIHWVILQSVAWTGMIIVYAQTAPLREAVEKAFDGKHPCPLCKVVQGGQKAEQKQQPQKTFTLKLDYFCNQAAVTVEVPPPFPQPIATDHHSPVRNETPPSPPPRLS